jgi:hypothetical protein
VSFRESEYLKSFIPLYVIVITLQFSHGRTFNPKKITVHQNSFALVQITKHVPPYFPSIFSLTPIYNNTIKTQRHPLPQHGARFLAHHLSSSSSSSISSFIHILFYLLLPLFPILYLLDDYCIAIYSDDLSWNGARAADLCTGKGGHCGYLWLEFSGLRLRGVSGALRTTTG